MLVYRCLGCNIGFRGYTGPYREQAMRMRNPMNMVGWRRIYEGSAPACSGKDAGIQSLYRLLFSTLLVYAGQ